MKIHNVFADCDENNITSGVFQKSDPIRLDGWLTFCVGKNNIS